MSIHQNAMIELKSVKMRISDVVVVIVCEGGEARVWLEVTRPCPPDRNDILCVPFLKQGGGTRVRVRARE